MKNPSIESALKESIEAADRKGQLHQINDDMTGFLLTYVDPFRQHKAQAAFVDICSRYTMLAMKERDVILIPKQKGDVKRFLILGVAIGAYASLITVLIAKGVVSLL